MQSLISQFLSKYKNYAAGELKNIVQSDNYDFADNWSRFLFRELLFVLLLGTELDHYLSQNYGLLLRLKSLGSQKDVNNLYKVRQEILRLFLRVADAEAQLKRCEKSAQEIRDEYLEKFGTFENEISAMMLQFAVIQEYLELTERFTGKTKEALLEMAKQNLEYENRLKENQFDLFKIKEMKLKNSIERKKRAEILNLCAKDKHIYYDCNNNGPDYTDTIYKVMQARDNVSAEDCLFYYYFSEYVKTESKPLPEIQYLGNGSVVEILAVQNSLYNILQVKSDSSCRRLEQLFSSELNRMSSVISSSNAEKSHEDFLVSRVSELKNTVSSLKKKYDIDLC